MTTYQKSEIPQHLQKYFVPAEIGLEATPELFIARLVDVFREVRRVLRSDGTLWVNIGDSYAGSWGNQGRKEARGTQREINAPMMQPVHDGRYSSKGSNTGKIAEGSGLKPKDLIGVPWMLAFALRADGWFLRQDIIWHKPNPMPESVRDRCTKAHEYVFLLTKSGRYKCDMSAISEKGNGFNGPDRRNKRSVWTITGGSGPEKNAHFATFPLELPETCILAGCPEGGTVLDPFSGAGTTGLAALKHGRRYVGIELNPEYIAISHARLGRHCPLLGEIA